MIPHKSVCAFSVIAVMLFVGVDYILNKTVTDDVAFVKVYKANPVNILQNFFNLHQSALLIRRQIYLSNIPGNYCFGIGAEPGKKHFHLHAGSVLGFIQNYIRII